GAKALRLWFDALGYSVTTIEGEQYAVPRNVGTVLVLAPSESVDRDEAATLEQWTRGGGRLVVADRGVWTSGLLRRFGVSIRPLDDRVDTAIPAPDGRLDPLIGAMSVQGRNELVFDRGTTVTPVLVGQRLDGPSSSLEAASPAWQERAAVQVNDPVGDRRVAGLIGSASPGLAGVRTQDDRPVVLAARVGAG